MAVNSYFTLIDPPAILAFPNLMIPAAFGAVRGKPKGAPKFDATFLIRPDSAEWAEARKMIEAVANDKFPNGLPAKMKWPVKDGTAEADRVKAEKGDREAYRGFVVLSAHTGEDKPPGLAAMVDGKELGFALTGDARMDARPYFRGGMNVRFTVNFRAYTDTDDKDDKDAGGVTAYLQMVASLGGVPNPKLEAGSKDATRLLSSGLAHTGQRTDVVPRAGLPI